MKDLRPLIEKKQKAEELTAAEINDFVKSLGTKSSPPDYQIASLLAFIFCKGMSSRETETLTEAMRFSGAQLNRKKFPRDAFLMDKHSTGGVGDKISLPLLPLVLAASDSIYIPMIAGRGLGHTGGTIDKLESIPGCRTEFRMSDFEKRLSKYRGCFSSQSPQITPADRILYALRDVTGTVASLPLIVASILSKKLSESLDYLLLDVKFGDAAFMQDYRESENLAQKLCEVARSQKVVCDAYQTRMQSPLGEYSGNRLEILETENILKGEGPADTTHLTLDFARAFLMRSGMGEETAESSLKKAIQSGKAFEIWEKIISSQGGDLSKCRRQIKSSFQKLKVKRVLAPSSGFIHWKAKSLGWALVSLGGGRRQKSDQIRPEIGFQHRLTEGQRVEKGQEVLKIYYHAQQSLEECLAFVRQSFEIREQSFSEEALIRKVFRDEQKLSGGN
jgi:pyrimidine-nucleoside phosphorylase